MSGGSDSERHVSNGGYDWLRDRAFGRLRPKNENVDENALKIYYAYRLHDYLNEHTPPHPPVPNPVVCLQVL